VAQDASVVQDGRKQLWCGVAGGAGRRAPESWSPAACAACGPAML